MTKAEIVNSISNATGIEKATTLAVVESFMENVKDSSLMESLFIFVDSVVLSSSIVQRRPPVTLQRRLL